MPKKKIHKCNSFPYFFYLSLSSTNKKMLYFLLQFAFDVGILAIFGHLEGSYREILKHNYNIVDKGYNSFPMNLPGTSYHKSLMV